MWSLAQPRVLPLYLRDKLLVREVAYQTVGNGLTRFLKEAKKALWPSFPISCGVYGREKYKHAILEISQIECLKLFTIPNKEYDPLKVANNFTTQVKIRPFVNEHDDFDDLFESVNNYAAVKNLETLRLHPQQLLKFQQYKNKILEKIPLKILDVSPTMTQKENESIFKDSEVINKLE